MLFLQLIGQGAFVAASLALGARLLLLWRRTREVPELTIGLSFLLGGGFAYLSWFALGALSAGDTSPVTIASIMRFGLACTCLAAVAHGVGVARIFRPGARWPLACLGALALWMSGIWWTVLVSTDTDAASRWFWAGILSIVPVHAWSAGEALTLAQTLHRRARLGMADPVVVNRMALWGVSSVVVVLMTSLSFASRLLHGPALTPWVSALNAGMGVVAAAAIWLGFFPPRALRERLANAYGS